MTAHRTESLLHITSNFSIKQCCYLMHCAIEVGGLFWEYKWNGVWCRWLQLKQMNFCKDTAKFMCCNTSCSSLIMYPPREHAMLAKTAGVKHLVVLVNKMDDPTVEWSEER